MGKKAIEDHDLGDEAFVVTPGLRNSGLGPDFNKASCISCHIRNGRGMPEPGQLLLRVTDSTALTDLHKSALSGASEEETLKNAPPVPGLGNQIQDFSVVGTPPEATVDILWKEEARAYADGTPYRLRSPQSYTDMLLHDMGEGLADNRADFGATGTEWRTPSLWGVGLAQTVLPYSGYLHDGRARTFEEAILWHGGEAEASQSAFEAMTQVARDALVKFLQSL